MYINMLDYIGTICNKQKCISELKLRVKELKNLSDNKIGFKINESHHHNYRYFTDCYKEVTEGSPEKVWMWVNSGFKDSNSCIVYFQFRITNGKCSGAMVGTEDEIVKYQSTSDKKDYRLIPLGVDIDDNLTQESSSDFEEINDKLTDIKDRVKEVKKLVGIPTDTEEEKTIKVDIQKDNEVEVKNSTDTSASEIDSTEKVKKQSVSVKKVTDNKDIESCTKVDSNTKRTSIDCEKTSAFYQELFNKLLIQTGWELTNTNLRYYIDVIITRLNYFLSKGVDCSEYITFNKDKSIALMNSGLLDKFGKNILFISKMHNVNEISFTNLFVVQSKSMLINYNFDKSSMNCDLHRVRFYNNDASELVFTGDIEDFDLENWDRLSHCISERKDRFPDEFKNSSDEVLCSDLIKAIELGVKLSKFDASYIKPIYNKKSDSIHFIIPYHVGNNFQKKPELGIVIANFDNIFWQVMTILSYEDCCSDIHIITPYSNESF